MGVVGGSGWNLCVWLAGSIVGGICGCKEVYRFPPNANLCSSCICFWQSIPTFYSHKKRRKKDNNEKLIIIINK